MQASIALGHTLVLRGELTAGRAYLARGIDLYDPQQHRALVLRYFQDPKVTILAPDALALWTLGYPDQAVTQVHDALSLAQELAHPFSLAFAQCFAAWVHQHRREGQATQEWAEAAISLSTEQGFAAWLTWGTIVRGWALVEQGQGEEGLVQMRQGIVPLQAAGADLQRSHFLFLLVEAYGKVGRAEEGLVLLAEALAWVDKTGERWWEAGLHWLNGQLTLQSQSESPEQRSEEAEACFQQALAVARKQEAKSWELRAATSLARLWQQQGKKQEARDLLAPVYNWFTEGFDTADLKDAKALLEDLSQDG
jgi:predicted ATPase